MRCYYCELEGGPGGTRYDLREAVGICAICSAGVCMTHAHHRTSSTTLLVCPEHVKAQVVEPDARLVPALMDAALRVDES